MSGVYRRYPHSYSVKRLIPPLSVVSSSPITGSAAITQSDHAVAGAGSVALVGTASITQADQSVASVGVVAIVGASSITQADNTIVDVYKRQVVTRRLQEGI